MMSTPKQKLAFLSFVLVSMSLSCTSPKTEELQENIPLKINVNNPLLSSAGGILFYDGHAFSGTIEEAYASGQPKSAAEYRKGKKNGVSTSWYEAGQRKSVRYFKHGRKVGIHHGWWPNGEPRFAYGFLDGFHHGKFLEWHENGQIAKSLNYESGKEVGEQKAWRENGKLYVNLVIKNGRRYGILREKACFMVTGSETTIGSSD